MKVREFLKQLQAQVKLDPKRLDMDIEVEIHTQLATCPTEEITSVMEGFDWGSGKVTIHTKKPLILKEDAHTHCTFLPEFICPLRSWLAFEYGSPEDDRKRREEQREKE